MDASLQPAMKVIKSGDVSSLRELLDRDAALATAKSQTGHPNLLQCLIMDGKDLPGGVEMAKLLIDRGAEWRDALVTCASGDNVAIAELLLDRGADVDGTGGWSPLE